MNIAKRFNTAYLLTLPFILAPFLITHRFQDPTLLIKRSGVFFLFAIIALILVIFKANRNAISSTNLKWLAGTVVFILALAIISSYNSINPSESYWEILYLSGWVSIYASFMIYSTKETMKCIIVASSVIGAVLSLLVFNDVYHWISFKLPMDGQLGATFGNKNFFGQYLCFIVPASIISLFMMKTNKTKFIMAICCILTIGGLILIRSRASWLGVCIALVVFGYLNRHAILSTLQTIKDNKLSLAILIVLMVVLIYFLNIPESSIGSRRGVHKNTVWSTLKTFTSYRKDSSWNARLKMYDSSWGIIKNHPVLGIGLGNWKLLSPKYADNSEYTDQSFTTIIQRPHNDFLWLLSEVGIIGMVFVIGFLIYHLRLLLMALKRGRNFEEERYILMFCLISLIAICIESMFDFPRQRTMPNLYLWSIMGFISSTSIQSIGKDKYQNVVPIVLVNVLSIVSIFTYFDLKSNIYSQDAKYYNNNNLSRELYASSAIALSFYRNLDNAGTPIYYYMGIAKHQQGDKNAAKLFFQKALQLAPFHLGALANYMILLGELGELTSAHKIMQIIQHIYPKMAKARLDMAKFYLREGNNQDAEKILLQLKENNLDDGKGTRHKLLSMIPTTLVANVVAKQWDGVHWFYENIDSFHGGAINNGDLGDNAWNTNTADIGAWIKLDVGAGNDRAFTSIRIWALGTYIATWDIQYSDDDKFYTEVVNDWNSGIFSDGRIDWTNVGAHRYWRLYKTNAAGKGAWQSEMQWYESTLEF